MGRQSDFYDLNLKDNIFNAATVKLLEPLMAS